MINEKIIVSSDDTQKLDKMKATLAIRNASYENNNLSCSLLDNDIINNCNNCSLNFICEKIDGVAEDYRKSITKVINNFSF